MDPISGVGAGLAIIGSKDLLNKILGPTADYLGEEVKSLVQKCNVNLDNIFKKAYKKLGSRIDDKGIVSSRVLKHIIDEGRFCEDELTAEYYGGILASSKTSEGRDDRGVSYLATLKDLSTYQIRFHYLFYFLIYNLFKGSSLNISLDKHRRAMCIYIPDSVYIRAMEFSKDENPESILSHCANGLIKHGLLSNNNYWYGPLDHVKEKIPAATEAGMMFEPTPYGADLFLWAQGLSNRTHHEIVSSEIDLGKPLITIIDGARVFSQ